jgi:hypothetical protein
MLQTMWMWIALACVATKPGAPDGATDSATPPDAGIDTDTGATAENDTGEGAVGMMLGSDPIWVSEDRGYATGGAFADMDGDGGLDLVVGYGNDMEPGPIVVYYNDGGALERTPSWSSAADRFHGHLAIGDVNGDGWPDVAVSRYLGARGFSEPGGVDVYCNEDGILPETPTWSNDGFFSFSVDLGDMDGDGDLDLAVAVGEAYHNDPDHSRVYENDGTGDFGAAPVWTTETPRHSFDVAWADLDADGWPDLTFANHGSGHTMYRNEGGALLAEPAWTAAGDEADFEGNTLASGDVDGDGSVDLVVSDNAQLGGIGRVRMWCGPSLDLCWTSGDAPEYQSAVSLHDVDADGDLDLVAGAWWGAVRVYFNQDGTLESTPSWRSTSDDIVVEAFAWGDVDDDGHPDLAVTDWTESSGNLLYGR